MRIVRSLLFISLFSFNLWAEEQPEKIKLLMVGNSFAQNASQFLPSLAKAGGKEIVLRRAVLGGCSLQRHAEGVSAFEADGKGNGGRIYPAKLLDLPQGESSKSLKEALELESWDFVTIQQVSSLSFKEETYEPYARVLVDYIHRYAPKAKLLVHQTWVYREDHAFFTETSLTPEAMYKGLSAAYVKLAQNYAAEIVPVGLAFQTARGTERWRFRHPDADFNYAKPMDGTLPKQEGSLNVGWEWIIPKRKKQEMPEQPKRVLALDAIHANAYGRYLGACVFYEVLFRDSVVGNTFVPKEVSPEDARMLQEIAHLVVQEYKANPQVLLEGKIAFPPKEAGSLQASQKQPALR